MFLSMAMLLACSVVFPGSSNPTQLHPLGNIDRSNSVNADISIIDVAVSNGYDSLIFTYFDGDNGVRNDLFLVSISLDNNNQESTIYLSINEHFNYYGTFGVWEDENSIVFSDSVVFYDSAINDYSYTIPYSQVDPTTWVDYYYFVQLNYLDRGQFDTLSGASSTSYQDGYNAGVTDGTQIGRDAGYQEGYAQGRADYENTSANINSIFNGILSIGLVPIEFFLSIFNFEIFGINITSLVSAILSMAVLVILLQYVLRGK